MISHHTWHGIYIEYMLHWLTVLLYYPDMTRNLIQHDLNGLGPKWIQLLLTYDKFCVCLAPRQLSLMTSWRSKADSTSCRSSVDMLKQYQWSQSKSVNNCCLRCSNLSTSFYWTLLRSPLIQNQPERTQNLITRWSFQVISGSSSW